MGQRYEMLRRFQPVLRILAWVAGGLGALGAIWELIWSLVQSRAHVGAGVHFGDGPLLTVGVVLGFWGNLLTAGVWWLGLMAAAELISVITDTEENTRLTAALLQEPEEESEAAT